MFWGDLEHGNVDPQSKYRLTLDVANYADEHDYTALWVPERHFHPWGGLFPNPAVIAAALAMTTQRIRLRAGSVVVPLHHPLRIAEEWSVVDNLSNGRIEIAVATGWKDDDFVLAPDKYAKRKTTIWDDLETIQSLWRGGTYKGKSGSGKEIEVEVYPKPLQPELPVWVTSAGSLRTATHAGGSGFNLLTHLLGQEYAELEKKIQQYNAYRARDGFKGPGKVSLMLHTFVGSDVNRVREIVHKPFCAYLKQSADLAISAEHRGHFDQLSSEQLDNIVEAAFDRYFGRASLMGTPTSCRSLVKEIEARGITEICCLIDYGVPPELVMESLEYLTELKKACSK